MKRIIFNIKVNGKMMFKKAKDAHSSIRLKESNSNTKVIGKLTN